MTGRRTCPTVSESHRTEIESLSAQILILISVLPVESKIRKANIRLCDTGRQLKQEQITAIKNVITDSGCGVSLGKRKLKTNYRVVQRRRRRRVLSGIRAKLKALSLPLLHDNKAELLAFQSRTADRKKKNI